METVKRLIDANDFAKALENADADVCKQYPDCDCDWGFSRKSIEDLLQNIPTVDAVEVVHGRWELTAHEEYSNYRWNVTAECSECHHSKGEVYAGFFPGFPQELARMTILDCAKSVKLDNYCPNCGAKMDGGNEDG